MQPTRWRVHELTGLLFLRCRLSANGFSWCTITRATSAWVPPATRQWRLGRAQDDSALDEYIRKSLHSGNALVGSCKMGTDASDSVVNPQLQVPQIVLFMAWLTFSLKRPQTAQLSLNCRQRVPLHEHLLNFFEKRGLVPEASMQIACEFHSSFVRALMWISSLCGLVHAFCVITATKSIASHGNATLVVAHVGHLCANSASTRAAVLGLELLTWKHSHLCPTVYTQQWLPWIVSSCRWHHA